MIDGSRSERTRTEVESEGGDPILVMTEDLNEIQRLRLLVDADKGVRGDGSYKEVIRDRHRPKGSSRWRQSRWPCELLVALVIALSWLISILIAFLFRLRCGFEVRVSTC